MRASLLLAVPRLAAVLIVVLGAASVQAEEVGNVADLVAPDAVLQAQMAQISGTGPPEPSEQQPQPFETDILSETTVTRTFYPTTVSGTVEYTERQGDGTEFSSKSANLSASRKFVGDWSLLAFMTLSDADTTAIGVPSDAQSVSLGGGVVYSLGPGLSGSATLFGAYSKSKSPGDAAPADNNPAFSYSAGASLGLVQIVPLSRKVLLAGNLSLSPYVSREKDGTVRKTDTDLRGDVGLSGI